MRGNAVPLLKYSRTHYGRQCEPFSDVSQTHARTCYESVTVAQTALSLSRWRSLLP